MDFSVPGSDLWESTPTQELFIESYFHHKEEPLLRATKKRKMVGCDKKTEGQQKNQKLESMKESQFPDTNQGQLLNRKSRKRKRKGRKALGSEERESAENPKEYVESKKSIVNIKKNKSEVSQSSDVKPVKKSGYKVKVETESALIEENAHNNSLSINKKSGRKFQDSKSLLVNPHALNPTSLPPKPKKLKLDRKTKLKSSKNSECPNGESMPSPKTKNMKSKKMSKNTEDSESESENSTSILKLQKPNPTKKLKKKKSLKSEHLENCSHYNQECHSEEFKIEESPSCPNPKKLMVIKNKKNKKASKDIEDSESESENLISNLKLQKPILAKKLKKKKSLRTDIHLENISEDDQEESDDEKIVSDIKNSSIFKEIQKLMKEAPFLQNLQDSDDTLSEVSGSSSDSNASEPGSIKNENKDLRKNVELKTSQNRSPVKSITLSNKSTISQNKLEFQPNQVNFPRAVKFSDFPRTLVENSSDSRSMKDNSSKNKAKLQGAKFRYLNEKLYTETGANAFQYFQENKEEFDDYHRGYSLQVSKWPINPVDKILSDMENIEEEAVIADMGCGDAKIARTLTNHTVHSFDIVALNDHVTPCNISKVPLAKESVDIVVFCLSLMGTNLKEYILEAHRILKMGGTLKIAEVESRIEDVNAFISKLKTLGFSLKEKDLKHKMFVFLDFKKVTKKVKKDKVPSLALKPCLYKKR